MGSLQDHRKERRGRSLWLCLTVILFAVTSFCSGEETTHSSVRDLRANLFANYDKLVRPVVHYNTTTTLYFAMSPLALTNLDEDKQIIELDTWLKMNWKDEYLVWNPEEYEGVTTFNIPSKEIWLPDLTIYTGSPENKVVLEVFTNVLINHTGDVLWVPPVSIRSRCPQNVDSHGDSRTCKIIFGSWTHHEYLLDLQLEKEEVNVEDFSNTNHYWELVSAKTERKNKYYSCCREPYPSVEYEFTLRRKSTCRAFRKSCSAQQMSHHHGMP